MALVNTKVIKSVMLIGLNRPHKLNAINLKLAQELTAAIENFEEDDSLKCGVLYGEGGNFCSGFDLQELSSLKPGDLPKLKLGNGFIGPSKRFIKKPLVAAVQGYAVAGGMELALMCDLRVMEENAITGALNRTHGVPLIDGATVRLPKLIGGSRALDIILTGRKVLASEALQIGFANQLTKIGSGIGQALQVATGIAHHPQSTMLADRISAHNAMFKHFDEDMEFEMKNGFSSVFSDGIPGASKFVSRSRKENSST